MLVVATHQAGVPLHSRCSYEWRRLGSWRHGSGWFRQQQLQSRVALIESSLFLGRLHKLNWNLQISRKASSVQLSIYGYSEANGDRMKSSIDDRPFQYGLMNGF